jgi:exoribonuclease-2
VGSPLETEARHRSTSIYLPELRIPMLPAILSENAFSLMPGEKRNAISFLITLDSEFNILEQKIVPSVVISKHRLSYDMAEHMIEEGEDDLSDEIRLVQEITEFSAANRRNHGAIDIDIPEFKLKWLPEESRYEFHPIDPSMMSRQLVSECMIMANALAAEFCSEHSIPALYRLQPPPNNMPDAQTLEAMPNDLIRAFAMRRCMMPAASSMTPGFHAGLGLDKYIQATSPLRRYADLLCHYQLESRFATQNPRFDAEEFNAILAETDLGLSKARSASHEAYQLATLKYLKQLGNQIIDAIILQYNTERGDIAQVALIETQVRANLSTKNRWPVGTLCRVRIENIRPEEGVIQLQFIEVIS